MADRIIQYHSDLGIITLIDPQLNFPWSFFCGGDINCCFVKDTDKGMNEIRIWVHKHATEQVYISRDTWKLCPVTFAFTSPEDAIKFQIAFGDKVERYS